MHRGQVVSRADSIAHLSALEVAHQEVDTCVGRLEAILAEGLKDVGQLTVARLQLRQANMVRTQVALLVSRFLIRVGDPQAELLDLKRRELEHSQLISSHVQSWDVHRITKDWDGYCRATRRVLRGVYELVAMERKMLCLPLGDSLRR